MKIDIEGLDVIFPYDAIYKEQIQYMKELKHMLDASEDYSPDEKHRHALLEMPAGTGKTVALFALLVAYRANRMVPSGTGKVIFVARTVSEMQFASRELSRVIKFREKLQPSTDPKFLAVSLSSRANLCVNAAVAVHTGDSDSVTSGCMALTSSWVRNKSRTDISIPRCSYFEEFGLAKPSLSLLSGVYSMSDLVALGKEKGWCPYFASRHLVATADIVLCTYPYLLDPKAVHVALQDEFGPDSIVIFDDAHDVASACTDALSLNVDSKLLLGVQHNLGTLAALVENSKESDPSKLHGEFEALVAGLHSSGTATDVPRGRPIPLSLVLKDPMPGSIRRPGHFISFLKRMLHYIRRVLHPDKVSEDERIKICGVEEFVCKKTSGIFPDDIASLRYSHDRLQSLLRALEVTSFSDFKYILLFADLCTLMGTFRQGFQVIVEQNDHRMPHISDPLLQLACVDSAIVMKPLLSRFRSILFTSTTLWPLEMTAKLLGFDETFKPVVSRSIEASMQRKNICPMVITRGRDQGFVSTQRASYERLMPDVVRNYGCIVEDFARVVPDGIVVLFPSHHVLEDMVERWTAMKILDVILQQKLIFSESKKLLETTLALDSYKKACDGGRGAVCLCSIRGAVSSGITFDRHYCRAVMILGEPYMHMPPPTLSARLDFLQKADIIKTHHEFLTIDAIRQVSISTASIVRSKVDYGIVVFVDSRFDKKSKVPYWLAPSLLKQNMSLSTEDGIKLSTNFLRQMAQGVPASEAQGLSFLTGADLSGKADGSASSTNPMSANIDGRADLLISSSAKPVTVTPRLLPEASAKPSKAGVFKKVTGLAGTVRSGIEISGGSGSVHEPAAKRAKTE